MGKNLKKQCKIPTLSMADFFPFRGAKIRTFSDMAKTFFPQSSTIRLRFPLPTDAGE